MVFTFASGNYTIYRPGPAAIIAIIAFSGLLQCMACIPWTIL